MKSNMTMRVVFILAAIILSVYLLYPTYRLSVMSDEQKTEMQKNDRDAWVKLKSKAINLGLDLQGGMHVLLEVNVKSLLDKLAKNKNPEFKQALDEAQVEVNKTDEDFVKVFNDKLKDKNMNIVRYYGDAERRSESDVIKYLETQTKEAVSRSLEILRNRVDEFGVSEPTIQEQGDRRIIVELAGVSDRERVTKIIGETALLEFKLLKDDVTTQKVAKRINDYLTTNTLPDSTTADTTKADTSKTTSLEEMFSSTSDTTDTTKKGGTEITKKESDENLFFQSPRDPQTILVPVAKEHRFKQVLQMDAVKKIIAEEAGSAEFLWGSKKELNDKYYKVYLVNKKQEMTGEYIIDTKPQTGNPNDPASIGKFEVSLTFNDEGAKIFSRVTGANVQKRLAIILDNKVYLAPTLQVKISNGRARITGLDTFDEAKDLSIVLKAGALPAPVSIAEERTVGPSLGLDSIKAGSFSAVLGLILVMFFMIIYYRFSGIVADIALILNIVFILAIMASLNATLTLPGIAGIILTIGMAVDANVLIFERIREELHRGKTIRASVDLGYGKAFVTILDANVTTFIAGLVLYTYGSGPVKGFAVTLMIGIVASMFTAIIVTRVIFNYYLERTTATKLSI